MFGPATILRTFGPDPGGGGPEPPTLLDNAILIAVADAVTYEINLGTYSQAVTAIRLYQPEIKLQDTGALKLSVVGRGIEEERLTRGGTFRFDCTVDVGIQKRVGKTEAALDNMSKLTGEIAKRLREHPRLTAKTDAVLININNDPVYAPDHLAEFHQFTSILSLTYRTWG